MVNYEPELMYALDSKSEYADWKNVYNVSGSDVLYCPICLGRVKLWNGQDPNKAYKKQRCFHHIDGMCSQESRIHFAYKTWLLEQGSKFKVGEIIYEVVNSEIEKTFHTKFGDYRPDITVETTEGKSFYIEIADTNKKTDDYIEKWDELGCDVLELDVNDQLIKATTAEIPEFDIIYSSSTGECYIKHYTRQDYDDLITERKIYWKRNDLIRYKIQWERLDWFWRKLQDFYFGNSKINVLIEAFKQMDSEDQRFVCKRMRGKHTSLRYELENNYTDNEDKEKANLNHISKTIREINKEFYLSTTNGYPYLCRDHHSVEFRKSLYVAYIYEINKSTTPADVYNYFYEYIKSYLEEEKERKLKQEKLKLDIQNQYEPILSFYNEKVNNCKYKTWKMRYWMDNRFNYSCEIVLFDYSYASSFTLQTNLSKDKNDLYEEIRESILERMVYLKIKAKDAINKEIRIMEEY